jgi:hypothetical protein
MNLNFKKIIVGLIIISTLLITISSAYASGFPMRNYPANQVGMETYYTQGNWGRIGVYGAYNQYPNFNGQPPYGYRTYGYTYTPWDLRTGATIRYTPYGSYW